MNSQASLAFDGGKGSVPCHDHPVLAFAPTRMAGDNWPASQQRAEDLFAFFADQGSRQPSERRFTALAECAMRGISVPRGCWGDIEGLLHT